MIRRNLWSTAIPFFLFLAYFFPGSALAKSTNWKTTRYGKSAQKAMKLGDMAAWGKALRLARGAFNDEKDKMSLFTRYNHDLWLSLLSMKFHQLKGILPPIKGIESFKSKQELQAHIQQFQKSIKHLQKSEEYLQRYHKLYATVAQKGNQTNLNYLQTALPLQQRSTIRDGKIYIALLDYAHQNWDSSSQGKNPAMAKQSAAHNKALFSLRGRRKEQAQSQAKLKARQARIAQILESTQRDYQDLQQLYEQRKGTSNVLFWTGITTLSLGVAGGLAGAIMHVWAASTRSQVLHVEFEQRSQIATIVLLGGVALMLTGGGMTLLSYLLHPSADERAKGILRAHNLYLDAEGKRRLE